MSHVPLHVPGPILTDDRSSEPCGWNWAEREFQGEWAHTHGGVWAAPGDILRQGARPKQSEAVVVHARIGCGIHKGRAAPVSCPVGGEHCDTPLPYVVGLTGTA